MHLNCLVDTRRGFKHSTLMVGAALCEDHSLTNGSFSHLTQQLLGGGSLHRLEIYFIIFAEFLVRARYGTEPGAGGEKKKP